jgi:hypothetical protein
MLIIGIIGLYARPMLPEKLLTTLNRLTKSDKNLIQCEKKEYLFFTIRIENINDKKNSSYHLRIMVSPVHNRYIIKVNLFYKAALTFLR